MEDDDLSANTHYLRSRSEIWKKCDKPETEFCSHQITNYASVFQPIYFKTYNFYSEGELSVYSLCHTFHSFTSAWRAAGVSSMQTRQPLIC